MKNENIRKTVGKSSLSPEQIQAEFNEFLRRNGLQKTQNVDNIQGNDGSVEKNEN